MTNFKHKPSKQKYTNKTRTLDEIHREHMNSFNENLNSLPQKKERLAQLKEKLDSLKLSNSSESIRKKSDLRIAISQLEYEISQYQDNNQLLNYILKTGNILLDYYSIASSNSYNGNATENTDNIDLTQIEEKNNVDNEINLETQLETNQQPLNGGSDKLKMLNKINQKTMKVKKPVKKRKIINEPKAPLKTIFHFMPLDDEKEIEKETENPKINIINRASLQEAFLTIIDTEYACDKIKLSSVKRCSGCNTEMMLVQSEGSYICMNPQCGIVEHVVIESEIPSHKDSINEKPKYPYKKVNHLKEKLSQLQAKETAYIPDSIITRIELDLKRKCIIPEKSKQKDIKKILKARKFTEYYEHLQQIYCKVARKPPITLSRETEEKIIKMFTDMQDSFRKYCPPERSNFLNYAYVLNKIFRIIGMPEYAEYFELLKSKNKLKEQDAIWMNICRDMGWKYYSSFEIIKPRKK